LKTSTSRRALPSRVSLADATFNLQRLAHCLAAVTSADPARLRAGLDDRCHQPYRLRLVPHLREILELQHPQLLGACLSGAGPSVVAIVARNSAAVERQLAAIYRRGGTPVTMRTLKVHQE
jgi:homoserine kinase